MYSRTIECVNTDDQTAVNFNNIYGGFIIDSIDGIYEILSTVNDTEYGATDGSHYDFTAVPKRNIVITGRILKDYQNKRKLLYRVFRPHSAGQFRYTEGDETKVIDYHMEKCSIPDTDEKIKTIQISLICVDPYFRGVDDVIISMAAWIGGFTFEHEFVDGGEEFGSRFNSLIKQIPNENGVDGIGMTITIGASGSVTNPKLYHLESGYSIMIGTAANPFVMDSADEIVIDTTTGKKNLYRIRNNVKTSINEYLDPASEFIQLNSGENTLRYAAESGEEYMNVTISYRMRYLGV